MAKLHEEVIVIKVSKLVRDDAPPSDILLNASTLDSLEAVVAELAGQGTLVEIQVA